MNVQEIYQRINEISNEINKIDEELRRILRKPKIRKEKEKETPRASIPELTSVRENITKDINNNTANSVYEVIEHAEEKSLSKDVRKIAHPSKISKLFTKIAKKRIKTTRKTDINLECVKRILISVFLITGLVSGNAILMLFSLPAIVIVETVECIIYRKYGDISLFKGFCEVALEEKEEEENEVLKGLIRSNRYHDLEIEAVNNIDRKIIEESNNEDERIEMLKREQANDKDLMRQNRIIQSLLDRKENLLHEKNRLISILFAEGEVIPDMTRKLPVIPDGEPMGFQKKKGRK